MCDELHAESVGIVMDRFIQFDKAFENATGSQ